MGTDNAKAVTEAKTALAALKEQLAAQKMERAAATEPAAGGVSGGLFGGATAAVDGGTQQRCVELEAEEAALKEQLAAYGSSTDSAAASDTSAGVASVDVQAELQAL